MNRAVLALAQKHKKETNYSPSPAGKRYEALQAKYNISFTAAINGGTLEQTCDLIEALGAKGRLPSQEF